MRNRLRTRRLRLPDRNTAQDQAAITAAWVCLNRRMNMQNLGLVLLVFAFVCACLASRGIGAPNWSLGWAAVAFWIAAEIFAGAGRAFGLH